jgi:hypothetical protein
MVIHSTVLLKHDMTGYQAQSFNNSCSSCRTTSALHSGGQPTPTVPYQNMRKDQNKAASALYCTGAHSPSKGVVTHQNMRGA